MQKTILTIGSSLVIAAFAPFALANQLYVDGSVGIADAELGRFETDDTFLRLGAGVAFSEELSLEAGFWDFGSASQQGVRVSADALFGAVKASTSIGNNLTLYGRLGLLRWDVDVSGPTFFEDDDGHDLIFGGGIGFPVGPGQVGVEIHFADLDEVDLRTIGVSYTLPIDI
ncbi:MAG: outer membrane beta-barrel protein [Cellvibrionaceae bacterium]